MKDTRKLRPYGKQDRQRQTMPPRIGASIYLGRLRQRLTTRQAAKLIGIGHGYLSLLEAGKRRPSRTVAQDIARVLLADRPREADRLVEAGLPNSGRDWKPDPEKAD